MRNGAACLLFMSIELYILLKRPRLDSTKTTGDEHKIFDQLKVFRGVCRTSDLNSGLCMAILY